MKKLIVILSIFFVPVVFLAHAEEDLIHTVERVINGDTIKLTNGEIVRLRGIVTFDNESNEWAKLDSLRTGQDLQTILKMGKKTTEHLKDMIKDEETIRLELDTPERDNQGRILAYVWLEPSHVSLVDEAIGGMHSRIRMVNAMMIEDGYAWPPVKRSPKEKYYDLFEKLYAKAKEYKKGLWSEGAFKRYFY